MWEVGGILASSPQAQATLCLYLEGWDGRLEPIANGRTRFTVRRPSLLLDPAPVRRSFWIHLLTVKGPKEPKQRFLNPDSSHLVDFLPHDNFWLGSP